MTEQMLDAGLDFIITQLFFDNAFYFDFVERARRAGINVPIVPGIMPVTSYDQLGRFIRLCGATVPMRLQLQLEKVKDDPEAVARAPRPALVVRRPFHQVLAVPSLSPAHIVLLL